MGWYNGHPDYADRFARSTLSSERAGSGRQRQRGTGRGAHPVLTVRERLAKTDIADHALEALGLEQHHLEVLVVGRRGAAQGGVLTTLELKELPEYTESGVDVLPEQVGETGDEDALSRVAKRNLGVMRDYAAGDIELGKRSSITPASFQRSPIELLRRGQGRGADTRPQRVAHRRGRLGQRARQRAAGGRADRIGTSRRRLPGRCDRRATVRPAVRGDPQRAGPGRWQRAGVRGRLDQARPDRDNRHQQEGLRRDGQPAAGGSGERLAAPPRPERDGGHRGLAGAAPAAPGGRAGLATDRRRRARCAGEPHGRPRVKLCDRNDLLDIALQRGTES